MTQWTKEDTAYTFRLGPFVDATDGYTPETGLTIAATDVKISKNGAAYAQKNDATALTGTSDADGFYTCVLDATDTSDRGKLDIKCQISGARLVTKSLMVVNPNTYDSLIGASDQLQVDVQEWRSEVVATNSVTGYPRVDCRYVGGTAQTGGDLYDGISANASALASLATDDDVATAVRLLLGNAGIKKNTALPGFTFRLTQTDGVTPATGLTVTAKVSLDGGSPGTCANSVSELSLGLYTIDLDADDVNGDTGCLLFTATGALPVSFPFVTTS